MITNIQLINTQYFWLALLEIAYWVWEQTSIWKGVWLNKIEWAAKKQRQFDRGVMEGSAGACALHEKMQASKAGLYRARSQHAKWVTGQHNVMNVLIACQAFMARPA